MAKYVSNIIEQAKINVRLAEEALTIAENQEQSTGRAAKQTAVHIGNKLADVKKSLPASKTSIEKKEAALKEPNVVRLTALFEKYTADNQSAKQEQQEAQVKYKTAEDILQQTFEKQR